MLSQPILRGASWWTPYSVSNVNCRAVERFKREKKDRDNGVRPGGGGNPGGGNPGSGNDDDLSRCVNDPDNCEEVDEPMTCTTTSESKWDPTTNTWVEVATVTCSY